MGIVDNKYEGNAYLLWRVEPQNIWDRFVLNRCSCGCKKFRPIGIQAGWKGRTATSGPKVLYLVNCVDCGTTRSCDRLQYALLQAREASILLEMNFFGGEKAAA